MADIPFQVEAWVEYGLGVLILFIRFFARWSAVGFQGRQGDDYFAVAALIFWTVRVTTDGTLAPQNVIDQILMLTALV